MGFFATSPMTVGIIVCKFVTNYLNAVGSCGPTSGEPRSYCCTESRQQIRDVLHNLQAALRYV